MTQETERGLTRMRLTVALISDRSRRTGAMVLVSLLGGVVCVFVWIVAEPAAAVGVAVLFALLTLLTKMMMELATDLRSADRAGVSQQRRIAAAERESARLRSTVAAQSEYVTQLLDRVRVVESVGRRQGGFNDAVLDRVRAVESVGRRQGGFNDAVLDRVRAVESAERRQGSFNDAVLDRVRSLEKATKRQDADFDATAATVAELRERVERVQAMLEAVVRYRDHRAGGHAELHLVNELRRLRSELESRS